MASLVAAPAPGAGADTIQVTCPPDDLQAEIDAADPGDVLEITGNCMPSAGTSFVVDKDLTLRGTPAATLTGNNERVLEIAGGSVEVEHLTITGGNSSDIGGGILNGGALTLTGSSVSDNNATSFGGGIYNDGGTLVVTTSTVNGNDGSFGGGILNVDGAVTLVDTVVSGNDATQDGGGIHNERGSARWAAR